MGNCLEVLVFDLDDTLYLESSYVKSGIEAVGEHVLRAYGLDGFASTAWAKHVTGERGRIFDHALDVLGRMDLLGEIPRLVRIYREHDPRISLTPDAAEVLPQLVGRLPLGMITDGPAISQQKKVQALGLPAIIHHIIITSNHGEDKSKPNPWAYAEVERICGVTGGACAYIGDNPAKDFIGARDRGWATVRVRREGGLHYDTEALPGYEADCEVSDLFEAMRHLRFGTINSFLGSTRIGIEHFDG